MYDCCDMCFRRWQDQTLGICPLALQSMPQLSWSSCCTKSSRVTLWSDTLMHSKLLWCLYWTCSKFLPCVIRLSWSAGSFFFFMLLIQVFICPDQPGAEGVFVSVFFFFFFLIQVTNWPLHSEETLRVSLSLHNFALTFVISIIYICHPWISEHMWPVVVWSLILCVVLQTWIHVLVLAFSAASYFGFVLLFSLFCVTCSPPTNPLGVETLQMSQPLFYIICTLTTVMALLPRYTHTHTPTHTTPCIFTHDTYSSTLTRTFPRGVLCRLLVRALHDTLNPATALRTAQMDKVDSERYCKRMRRWNQNHSRVNRLPVSADNPGLEPSTDTVVSWPPSTETHTHAEAEGCRPDRVVSLYHLAGKDLVVQKYRGCCDAGFSACYRSYGFFVHMFHSPADQSLAVDSRLSAAKNSWRDWFAIEKTVWLGSA